MIPIDQESARIGRIVRITTVKDADGNSSESSAIFVGDHIVDIQPMSPNDKVTASQLGVDVTHKVYPETDVSAGLMLMTDFYEIEGKRYRIMWKFDYGDGVVYFFVLEGAFGKQ